MKVIVDAQVVQAYYIEARGHGSHECSCNVSPAFQRFGSADELWIDDAGHIEAEWRNLVNDDEWYENWFFSLVTGARALLVPCQRHHDLIQSLGRDFHFPRGSGDKWYIITAASLRDASGDVPVILSEDMDLHEPRSKHLRGAARRRILEQSRGSMAKHLRRNESIDVRCTKVHLERCSEK